MDEKQQYEQGGQLLVAATTKDLIELLHKKDYKPRGLALERLKKLQKILDELLGKTRVYGPDDEVTKGER